MKRALDLSSRLCLAGAICVACLLVVASPASFAHAKAAKCNGTCAATNRVCDNPEAACDAANAACACHQALGGCPCK